jgi:hypothetical protein
MRERKRIAAVVPVGPKDAEDAFDTLASMLYYLDSPRIIVVVDDTGPRTDFARQARELSPDIVVLPAPEHSVGGFGGLWSKIAAGYAWLLERYEPDVVLRLDVDALVIGPGIEVQAAREFSEDPNVGLLGSYRIGPDGGLRDWSWPARRLDIEVGFRGIPYPSRRKHLRELIALARRHGYVNGEHALGGSYIHSLKAADDIHAKGWFNQPYLATSKLGEDHIMALITVAAGYRIADFGRPADPMALKWRGLPSHPDELIANEKLITHSVRSWDSLKESEIRGIFKAARL